MIKKCIRCGAKYTQDFDFCPKCGGALEIDPDWLNEQNRKVKAEEEDARRREENRRKDEELRAKVDQLFKYIPAQFVVDGVYFDTEREYYLPNIVGTISNKLRISDNDALAKLTDLADMLSNKKSVNLSSLKEDLRKQEDDFRKKLEKISYNPEIHLFVKGGEYKVEDRLAKDAEVFPGTRKSISDPWSDCTAEARGYIIRTYDVFEYDGSLARRCERIIGYSSNGEALKKYFMLKTIMRLLDKYLDDMSNSNYRRFMDEVSQKAPELKVKRMPRQKVKEGPREIRYYSSKGWC